MKLSQVMHARSLGAPDAALVLVQAQAQKRKPLLLYEYKPKISTQKDDLLKCPSSVSSLRRQPKSLCSSLLEPAAALMALSVGTPGPSRERPSVCRNYNDNR